jgi:hypothetical protein
MNNGERLAHALKSRGPRLRSVAWRILGSRTEVDVVAVHEAGVASARQGAGEGDHPGR